MSIDAFEYHSPSSCVRFCFRLWWGARGAVGSTQFYYWLVFVGVSLVGKTTGQASLMLIPPVKPAGNAWRRWWFRTWFGGWNGLGFGHGEHIKQHICTPILAKEEVRVSLCHTQRNRFHGMVSNPYPLPNDDVEKDRLDDLQECFRTLLGGNIVVPIRHNPTQIGSSDLKSTIIAQSWRWNRLWEMGYWSCR